MEIEISKIQYIATVYITQSSNKRFRNIYACDVEFFINGGIKAETTLTTDKELTKEEIVKMIKDIIYGS